ncbi:MAG: signal peptidase I [Chloroflexaceae bacterium]|nr:signal peptidase I [Chloroflexaceae bacterium]
MDTTGSRFPYRKKKDAASLQSWNHFVPYEHEQTPTLTVRSAVRELLETVLYIVLVFVIVRSMVQNFKIEGSSMEPSLHNEQYILVNKLVYFNFDLNAPLRMLPGSEQLPPRLVYPLGLPRRGDIIVFRFPGDIRKDYIKRVIGLPGETIAVRDGSVYINDQLLDEPYLKGQQTHCNANNSCADGTPIEVPSGTIFVMGDNRDNSSDSREWNALPLEYLIGQAWILYYPVDDLGLIPHPSYASD